MIRLEVCVDLAESIDEAIAGGADRIELCSALELGGMTPGPGFMAYAARQSVPSYAMIRPRGGDFTFSPVEVEMMEADIDAARAAGLAGVVLGANHENGTLDIEVLARLKRRAEGMGTTLHRSFDLTPDPFAALEEAVALGFERILTSGQARSATQATELLYALSSRAGGRISIMPGAGVRPINAATLVAATGVREIHASASLILPEAEGRVREFGFAPVERRRTSRDEVSRIKASLAAL
jgi:copper homeostasis protein